MVRAVGSHAGAIAAERGRSGKFIQVIDYEAPEAVERGRQQIASDQRVQAYLQAWRALLPGAVEVDVYRELDL